MGFVSAQFMEKQIISLLAIVVNNHTDLDLLDNVIDASLISPLNALAEREDIPDVISFRAYLRCGIKIKQKLLERKYLSPELLFLINRSSFMQDVTTQDVIINVLDILSVYFSRYGFEEENTKYYNCNAYFDSIFYAIERSEHYTPAIKFLVSTLKNKWGLN